MVRATASLRTSQGCGLFRVRLARTWSTTPQHVCWVRDMFLGLHKLLLMKHRYIRLALEPRCTDGLRIRKTLQDALQDMFGLVFAGTYIDVLSVDEPGSEAVIRVHAG